MWSMRQKESGWGRRLWKKKGSKKGSVTIFTMMLLVSLLSMALVFIDVAKDLAVKGSVKELGMLWEESVLGEYDKNLASRYGIFGFYGSEDVIQEKLDWYARATFSGKRYVSYDGCSVEMESYNLTDPEQMREQMVRTGRYAAIQKLPQPAKEIKAYDGGKKCEQNVAELWNDLPSQGKHGGLSVQAIKEQLQDVKDPADWVKKGSNRYFSNQYLFHYFRHQQSELEGESWFLKGEIEYVIGGKHTDEENQKKVKRRIIAFRLLWNMAYILEDPEMNAETLSVAEVLTPGPIAPLTQKALQAAWAAAESSNDYKLLMHGKKVPLHKNKQSWAVDIKNIVKGNLKETESPEYRREVPYIDPGNTTGKVYRDYLEYLCYLMNDDMKIYRMMDLMQITMRRYYYGDFRLYQYNGGLNCVYRVNGGNYEVDRSYTWKKRG